MEFLNYKKFYDEGSTDALAQTLKEHGIEYQISQDRESLDSLYGDKQFSNQFFVKIKKEDFNKANAILTSIGEKEIANVDKDHYLYEFSNEELFDILSKPEEWNAFDYQLAQKLLRERGKQITPDIIELIKTQRINELAKPLEGGRLWIFFGYVSAFLGGIIGIFIGWHLCTYRKTLPNGQQVYGYTPSDRAHGRSIWILGTIMFIALTAYKISRLE